MGAAIAAVGGPAKAAEITGRSLTWVYQWQRLGTVHNLRDALTLAAAAGVPVETLCA